MTTPDFENVHLWNRLVWAKENLKPVQTDYVVVFEDNMDEPAKVLVPAPEWMACAMNGGILPPVEVYHNLEINSQGEITNGHTIHSAKPLGPLTEEEAIEYLVKKDVPRHVWENDRSNRTKFVICKKQQLPQSREWRNAWRLP